MSNCIYIEKWSAWAPGLTTSAEWSTWAAKNEKIPSPQTPWSTDSNEYKKITPDVSFLGSNLKRRTSSGTKNATAVAHAVLDNNTEGLKNMPSVFSSRYGEAQVTFELLSSLSNKEPLSPNKFSLSVHNTAAGLHSIAQSARLGSTTIAAGTKSLSQAFIESLVLLKNNSQSPYCLLVYSEEVIPELFRTENNRKELSTSLALILRSDKNKAQPTMPSFSIRIEENDLAQAGSDEEQIRVFILWLMNGMANEIAYENTIFKGNHSIQKEKMMELFCPV